MQTTINLLDAALTKQPAPFWTERLKLSRGALHTAKTRGHLSPAIAYALAEEIGENAEGWAEFMDYQPRGRFAPARDDVLTQ